MPLFTDIHINFILFVPYYSDLLNNNSDLLTPAHLLFKGLRGNGQMG